MKGTEESKLDAAIQAAENRIASLQDLARPHEARKVLTTRCATRSLPPLDPNSARETLLVAAFEATGRAGSVQTRNDTLSWVPFPSQRLNVPEVVLDLLPGGARLEVRSTLKTTALLTALFLVGAGLVAALAMPTLSVGWILVGAGLLVALLLMQGNLRRDLERTANELESQFTLASPVKMRAEERAGESAELEELEATPERPGAAMET